VIQDKMNGVGCFSADRDTLPDQDQHDRQDLFFQQNFTKLLPKNISK